MSPRSTPTECHNIGPSTVRLSFLGRYCTCFHAAPEHNFWACRGLNGKLGRLESERRGAGECPSLAVPAHCVHVCFPSPTRCLARSHAFFLAFSLLTSAAFAVLMDAPPGKGKAGLDRPPARSELTQPGAAVWLSMLSPTPTDFSNNGRALLHAAVRHVPIACSYINNRAWPIFNDSFSYCLKIPKEDNNIKKSSYV